MGRFDVDLYIANIEKFNEKKELDVAIEELKENALNKIKKIRNEICNLKDLQFERKKNFNKLFSICLPCCLFEHIIEEENIVVFQSPSNNLALAVKMIEEEYPIDLDLIKQSYQEQMLKSKQQTQFDLSGSKIVNGLEVFYFTASHTMPEQKQFDYIFMLKLINKIIVFDFNMKEEDYSYWKIIIQTIIGTIRQEEIYGGK